MGTSYSLWKKFPFFLQLISVITFKIKVFILFGVQVETQKYFLVDLNSENIESTY